MLKISIFKSNLFLFIVFITTIWLVAFFFNDEILRLGNAKFRIQKIEFDGNERVKDILLLKTSGLRYNRNILAISIRDIKEKLENISWIKSVVVQRKLPNTVCVRIAERTPVAILQSKHKLYFIDSDGRILENDGMGNFNDLPIVVGKGAEKEANRFIYCINKFPKIRSQLVFAVRIGERRWNIRINKGITVKLPEKGVAYALGILEEISDKNGFFNDDISVIDLRMLDRVVVTKKI